MLTTGIWISWVSRAIVSKIPASLTCRSSARVYDAWITGPSAIGSLYGMPSSHSGQPRPASWRNTSAVNAKSGSPAVTNGISALRPWERRSANKRAEQAFDAARAAEMLGRHYGELIHQGG